MATVVMEINENAVNWRAKWIIWSKYEQIVMMNKIDSVMDMFWLNCASYLIVFAGLFREHKLPQLLDTQHLYPKATVDI